MVEITKTAIDGVLRTKPSKHGDDRGYFIESYRREWFQKGREMIQSNRADRKAGSIVGFHYHLHQADYWYVPFGRAQVLLHDLRKGSPTEGVTAEFLLGGDDPFSPDFVHDGLYIPPGVAHGFCSLTDMTITYQVDGYYNQADELGILWNDPELKASWKIDNPIISERDQQNPLKKDIQPMWMPHIDLRK